MKIKVKCKWCKDEFLARKVDRKRGWAKFCSKSCKAKEQTKRTGVSGPTFSDAMSDEEWANLQCGDEEYWYNYD